MEDSIWCREIENPHQKEICAQFIKETIFYKKMKDCVILTLHIHVISYNNHIPCLRFEEKRSRWPSGCISK